jgi:hypothetical protein
MIDANGKPVRTPHGFYANDDIYLNIADIRRFKQAIAANIEAIFILLGDSNTALLQDPISWDKLHELLVAPVNCILGLVLDLCCMTVGILPEFISSTVTLLRTTLGPHRCSFNVKEAEELTCKLNHIAFGEPWLKYLLGSIYSSLAAALHLNHLHLVHTSPRFHATLCDIHSATATTKGDTKRAFYFGANACSVHGSPALHHIGTDLHRDLTLIKRTL